MKQFYSLCLLVLGFFFFTNGYGQTYTFDINNSGNCNGQWGDSDCWSSVADAGCTPNTAGVPPINPPSNRCEVNIVVNSPVEYSGDLLLQGNFGLLKVTEDGELTVNGDIEVEAVNEIGINVEGGELQVEGQVFMQSGTSSGNSINPTILNINITNEGVFEVHDLGETGNALELSNNTELNIDGDDTNEMWVKSVDLAQRSIINIMDGGGLIVDGPTEYNGSSSEINVYGFFRTAKVDIQGGNGHQLNSFNDAEIIIEGDIVLGGTSDITFNGNSEVDVGGNIVVNGGSKVIASDSSRVYVCGEYPDPDESNRTEELIDGQFVSSCRILPVVWVDINAKWNAVTEVATLEWSTAKEWETNHFIIERSLGDVEEFEQVGRLEAVGWSDVRSDYKFEDADLSAVQGRVYYRVKQVDMKGEVSYSETVAAQLPKVKQSISAWKAYPNPTTGDDFKVVLADNGRYQGEKLTTRLMNGTTATAKVEVEDEWELSSVLSAMLGDKPQGLWVVEISWGDQVEHIKVLKQ